MENKSGFHPSGDRVLVKPDKVEETIGEMKLIVPETIRDNMSGSQTLGYLVEVGPDAWTHFVERTEGGRTIRGFSEPFAEVGDRVMFAIYGGMEFEGLDGDLYRILNDVDITGTCDDEVTNNNLQSRKRMN